MRDLETGFDTLLDDRDKRPMLLMQGQFDSGNVNFFSGTGEFEFNGETYLGGGKLLTVSPIEETQELKATNTSFELSGVDPSLLSVALGERIYKRPAFMWFGLLAPDNSLKTVQIYSGYMDTMPIRDDIPNGEATITLNTESDLLILRKAVDRNYTPEDQKIYFAGDLFFDFVPLIQDIEINWGPPA